MESFPLLGPNFCIWKGDLELGSYKKIIISLLVMESSLITIYIERKAAGPIINKEIIIVFLLCKPPT